MLRPLNRAILMLGSLTVLVAGCAANPSGAGQVDMYGNPINAYGSGYDTGYGSEYGTGDSYSGDYGGDYSGGSDYGSDYGTGSDYGSDYGSGGDYGAGDSYTGASPSPSPSATPGAEAGSLDDRPVLTALILEVKESGLMGMGKIIAKVEVENPGNVTLSGKLRVLFTDNGDPTANAMTRRVTLAPKEKQVLTFTAKAWRLDDAEASIETDAPKKSKSDALN